MAGQSQSRSEAHGESAVLELQQLLARHGYLTQAQLDTGPGVLGPKTREALARVLDGEAPLDPSSHESPSGASSPPRPPMLTPRTHRVRSGDTLSKLALDYNVSLDALVATNHIQDVRLIWVGQVLTLPREASSASPPHTTPPPSSSPGRETPAEQTPAGQGTAPRSTSQAHPAAAGASSGFCFPFSSLPGKSWRTGARAFGANRKGGRKHGGCDLYFPMGTWIHAVADGEVIAQPYNFYCATQAMEIRHGSLIVRYGEIKPRSFVGGTTVKRGQRLCQVGHLVGIDVESDMLHLELYAGTATGPLSVKGKAPYMRRKDLLDPSPYLDLWSKNLPPP